MIFLAVLAWSNAQHVPVATPLTPATPPQNWVTNRDYPLEALASHKQGTVGFTLEVGVDGKVSRCTVKHSSGSVILDKRTCDLMMLRASFVPAKDYDGNPIKAAFNSTFNWKLR